MSDLKPGWYSATPSGWFIETSKNGQKYLLIEWKFSLAEFKSARFSSRHFFHGGAGPHTMKDLARMGFKGASLKELSRDDCGLGTKEVRILIEEEEYNGKTSLRLKAVADTKVLDAPVRSRDASGLEQYDFLLQPESTQNATQEAIPSAAPGDEIPF